MRRARGDERLTDGKRRFWIGVAITLLGGTLWGVSGTSVQYLTTAGGASPALVTFLRTLLGGGIFFAFLLLTKSHVVKTMLSCRRTVGALFALPVYLLQGNTLADAATVLTAFGGFEWLVFLGGLVVVGTICGYGLYLHGVAIVGSVKGSLLGAIEPVSATVLAALWLGTAFTGYDLAGLVLMCVMVAFVTSDEDDASSDDGG